ncbi:MAG: ABC transporter permease [Alphaproteobacteria bacterium]|nr:ABC transporter permease [Alphaproteobacteria bacterium]
MAVTVANARRARLPAALGGALRSNVAGLVIGIAVFTLAFALYTSGFTSRINIYSLSRSIGINGVVGLAMMAVLVTGGLNLALGAIGVCSAMVVGWALQALGLGVAPALLLGLIAGAALGAINGLIVVTTRLHSFVVTLATMSIFFGGMVLLSGAQGFNALPPGLTGFGRMRLFGMISPLLIVLLIVGFALFYLYRFTALGREMLAAGANPVAAKLAGLPVERLFVLCHALSGALGAVAGVLASLRNGAIVPSMAGPLGSDWLLPAFLIPVLGGTLLTGGEVSVLGTVLGAVFVEVMTSGLYMLQIGEFWIQTALGLVLLGAILLERARAGMALARGRQS